jgi:hypothetical protein
MGSRVYSKNMRGKTNKYTNYSFSFLIVYGSSYVGVSKSSQITSTDRQPMALRECVRCA